jgi:hypothetical protein
VTLSQGPLKLILARQQPIHGPVEQFLIAVA